MGFGSGRVLWRFLFVPCDPGGRDPALVCDVTRRTAYPLQVQACLSVSVPDRSGGRSGAYSPGPDRADLDGIGPDYPPGANAKKTGAGFPASVW